MKCGDMKISIHVQYDINRMSISIALEPPLFGVVRWSNLFLFFVISSFVVLVSQLVFYFLFFSPSLLSIFA